MLWLVPGSGHREVRTQPSLSDRGALGGERPPQPHRDRHGTTKCQWARPPVSSVPVAHRQVHGTGVRVTPSEFCRGCCRFCF